jgi:hypothetical protein
MDYELLQERYGSQLQGITEEEKRYICFAVLLAGLSVATRARMSEEVKALAMMVSNLGKTQQIDFLITLLNQIKHHNDLPSVEDISNT